MYDLVQIAQDFAQSLKLADAKRPQAINVRSKQPFRPGIGPHTEAQTVALVASEMEAQWLRPLRLTLGTRHHRFRVARPYKGHPWAAASRRLRRACSPSSLERPSVRLGVESARLTTH